MKNYEELTGKEIMELEEENIQDLIDLECANEGIKLIKRPNEPQKPELQNDIICYKIDDMIFKTQKEAQMVFDVLREIKTYKTNYNYESGYDFKYLEVDDDFGNNLSIKKTTYLSKKKYKEHEEMLVKYESDKSIYDTKYQKWSKENDKRREIEEIVRVYIDKVYEKESEKQDMLIQYKRYLELTNNDELIAKKFLCDAHGKTYVKATLGTKYLTD